MTSVLRQADDIVRGRGRSSAIGPLTGTIVAFGVTYGAAMGSFGGLGGDRGWQLVFSAVKVPLLLLATLGLSLPSFFVLNTLLGVRSDFGKAVQGVLEAQAGVTIILVGLAPLTLFWYASSADYPAAILFNALMFAVASLGAQGMLRRSYRPLIARDGRHRLLLRAWLVIYAFVGIQMGWLLRPFIGDPAQPVTFFRGLAGDNAYVIVARLIWKALAG